MTYKIILLISFLLISLSVFAIKEEDTTSFTGKITDAKTHEPLLGIAVYFPEIQKGALSDIGGLFIIDDLPKIKLTLQVSLTGYQTIIKTINLAKTNKLDLEMTKSITELNKIVLTGQIGAVDKKHTSTPISVVTHTALIESTSTNIIGALSEQAGVSQVTTGSAISKPVIRGLGYNRVVVVNNGVRQEGQQWGDEHGIEIDEYSVNHAEILKGPASLAFGSDAMAGVINMFSAPTVSNHKVGGHIISNYQTNNGLLGYSANLMGNQNGLVWDARYSNKQAHDYKNKYDNPVFNSRFRENATSLMLGLNRSWGYSHLVLSLYNLKPGLIEGERDKNSGNLVKPNGDIVTSSDTKIYNPDLPFQEVSHYKAVWRSKIFLKKGNLNTIIGFQQNNRQEYEESKNQYGLYFKLNTVNYKFQYAILTDNDWKLSVGIGGMWQQSINQGTEFLIPEYQLFDFGIFTIANKRIGNFNLSGGLRFDRRDEAANALYLKDDKKVSKPGQGVENRFSSFNKIFNGYSWSLGSTYQINELLHTKLNISQGFRAPNISELAANGKHEGVFRYEIGNTDLQSETSLQLDWGTGLESSHISAEINLFKNTINNFIFIKKTGLKRTINDEDTGNTDQIDEYKFSAGDASLYGGELYIDIHPHPLDFIHFGNTFSYTRGTFSDASSKTSRNLPLIPAPRWVSKIKLASKKITPWLENSYISFAVDYNFEQDKFLEENNTETYTPGYALLNIGLGTNIKIKGKKICALHISGNNLSDLTYQSHLNRLKNLDVNNKTGRRGVFNMGRNISFKLLIPLDIIK